MKKITKKVLAILLAITMLIISIPTAVIAETDESTSEYIEVSTIEDLYNIRNDLTANYILMNDIDLTEATAEGGDYDFMGNGWNPIGSGDVYDSEAFSGTFDGNGKRITGMRIDITTLPSGTGTVYAGLFANVTGTVKNLTLTGDIYYNCSNSNSTGSFAGYCNGTIENCINYVNVISVDGVNGYVGGIAGSAGINAVINNCANNGNVKSSRSSSSSNTVQRYAGGIVGKATSTTKISYCYNTGEVYSYATGYYTWGSSSLSGSYVITHYGYAYSCGITDAGAIVDCYNTGDVTAEDGSSTYDSYDGAYAEGIGGDTIARCYNIGNVIGENSNYAISEHAGQNCYYLTGVGNTSTGATSLTELQIKTQSMYNGFDFENTWVINNTAVYPYPQHKNNPQDLRIIEGITINSLPSKTEYIFGEKLVIDGATLCVHIKDDEPQIIPITYDMVSGYDAKTPGTQTLTVTYKGMIVDFEVVVSERPYIEVYTIEDLYCIRYDLAANYILMNDIDLTDATAEGGDYDFMGNGWNPIGSNDVYSNEAFSGIFDGNGHTIKGMRIELLSIPEGIGSNVYLGLFANVTGNVHNLTLCDGYVASRYNGSFGEYIGNLAAISSGTIRNVHNNNRINPKTSTAVSGSVWAGGLLGYNEGIISLCDNSAKIFIYRYNSAISYIGGIAGYSKGIIDSCYNTGVIKVTVSSANYDDNPFLGGITGYNGGTKEEYAEIINCYNVGDLSTTVSGETTNNLDGHRNGIAYINTYSNIRNCYSIGDCKYGVGYIVNSTYATIKNSYYLNNGAQNSAGATSLTEAQMKLQSLYKGFDFENVWFITKDGLYEYPQLKTNPQESRILKSATLSALPDNLTYYKWENLDITGAQITLEYENADIEVIDVTSGMISGYDPLVIGNQTVTVSYNTNVRTFVFTFDVIVNEFEYQEIRTIEDLYNIRENMRGNYILMNDIDLTDATAEGGDYDFMGNGWNPIGSGDVYGNEEFSGIFDGNGYTIKGMRISDSASLPSGVGDEIYLGLFANNAGTIKNVHIEGTITSQKIKEFQVGGIAATNSGIISGCSNEVKINITRTQNGKVNNGGTAGGIVGYNTGIIEKCYNQAMVSVVAREYSASVGGISGYGHQGTIENCYNLGDITANITTSVTNYKAYAGGIQGHSYCPSTTVEGSVKSCYNIGVITAKSYSSSYYKKSAITLISGLATINDCYYLAGTGDSSTGATSLTEAQMKLQSLYRGFDFENVWMIDANAIYPYPQLKSNIQDARVIDNATIKSLPDKLVYESGEALDTTGLTLEVNFTNADTEYVDITADMVTGFDTTTIGTQTLSVTYYKTTLTFDVTVKEKGLLSIEIQSQPDKSYYVIGEELDLTGLVVVACYENGETKTITDYTVSGFESTLGTKDITVTYGGLSCDFNVLVIERSQLSEIQFITVGSSIGRLSDEVTIPVSVTNNTGLAGFTHAITFDATALELVSVNVDDAFADGTIILNDQNIANGEITVLWFGSDDVVGDGVMYNLVFKVLETAQDGNTEIAIAFDENDNANVSGENVIFGAVNGSIEVRSYWLGDLDGDRKYYMGDLLQLAQYVAGIEMTLTDKQLLSADVNEDGTVDIHDVVMLQQWLLVADI